MRLVSEAEVSSCSGIEAIPRGEGPRTGDLALVSRLRAGGVRTGCAGVPRIGLGSTMSGSSARARGVSISEVSVEEAGADKEGLCSALGSLSHADKDKALSWHFK